MQNRQILNFPSGGSWMDSGFMYPNQKSTMGSHRVIADMKYFLKENLFLLVLILKVLEGLIQKYIYYLENIFKVMIILIGQTVLK
jgi:hypothetical protein